MARVSIPEKDQVSNELKDLFQSMEQRGARILNVYKVMAHCPRVGREFLRLGNAILFNGSLPPKLRELAILRVGDLAEATYEWTQHVPLGLTAGLTEEQIKAMHGWKDSPLFSNQERAILQYTDEVAQNIRVSEKTFKGVRDFLTEEQVVELTTTIGYYGMVSRILEALEIELEENKPPLR
ncbi:MAG TPA: carboxymuconolactone decarboxylase family protein [Nitrospiraceae bacterium]|jgi:alkylhydroperoxidase family enzyme|nr:carboxymuconolactone decarboxylase family protein [Nitrospiraceae bacterium]